LLIALTDSVLLEYFPLSCHVTYTIEIYNIWWNWTEVKSCIIQTCIAYAIENIKPIKSIDWHASSNTVQWFILYMTTVHHKQQIILLNTFVGRELRFDPTADRSGVIQLHQQQLAWLCKNDDIVHNHLRDTQKIRGVDSEQIHGAHR